MNFSLNVGQIVGISVSVSILAIILIVVIIYYVRRRRQVIYVGNGSGLAEEYFGGYDEKRDTFGGGLYPIKFSHLRPANQFSTNPAIREFEVNMEREKVNRAYRNAAYAASRNAKFVYPHEPSYRTG